MSVGPPKYRGPSSAMSSAATPPHCVVFGISRQEQTADLHGSSCGIRAWLSRLSLKLPPREGTFLLSKLMFLVFLVISVENAGDDCESMLEIRILGRQ